MLGGGQQSERQADVAGAETVHVITRPTQMPPPSASHCTTTRIFWAKRRFHLFNVRPGVGGAPRRYTAVASKTFGSMTFRHKACGLLLALATIVAACSNDDNGAINVPSDDSPTAQPIQQADSPPIIEAPERILVTGSDDPATEARILLVEADQLERNGFWEESIDLRSVVLLSAEEIDHELLSAARLNQARLLLRLDRPVQAESVLLAIEQAELRTDQTPIHQLLLARTLALLGEPQASLDSYQRYLDDGGPARSTIQILRAALLVALDDGLSAITAYNAVLADPAAPAWDIEAALLQLGLLHENRGEYADAATQYQRLYDISPWVGDDTFALLRLGAVRWELGDSRGAEDSWTELVEDYAWHARAGEAYDALTSRGLAVDPNAEGLLLYRQFDLNDARFVFANNLAVNALPIEQEAFARYYLGAIDEDLGDTSSAIANYLRAADLAPEGDLADNALWWSSRLLQERGDLAQASTNYQRLATSFPSSEFAMRAGILAGLLPLQLGDLAAAENRFLSVASAATVVQTQQRAWLWIGKLRDARGDDAGAASAFQRAVDLDPVSYSGLRAHAHLQDTAPQTADLSPLSGQISQNASSLTWLETNYGPEETAPLPFSQGPAWRAAVQLESAGLQRSASIRFDELIDAAASDPWLLYRMGQQLKALGIVHRTLDVGERLLAELGASERAAAPSEILRWAYPQGWPAVATTEASEVGIDELLLYALIRQESRFNPDAGSNAGALGLTQVIPPTAQAIATALSDEAFNIDLLFRPERSIAYGAYYLSEQLDNFGDAPWIALAAYNGGPGNADRWSNGDVEIDPDLFFDQITFTETRLYVELVLENLAWYQFVYRDQPNFVDLRTGTLNDWR
jgi:soluble lytic murein transglycosylase-like protein/TolA-binding protein